jgi:putative DNA primase/helicase
MSARDIASRLGLRRSGRDWRGACPACGYAGTLILTEREGRTLWWCAACRDGDAIARALGFERGRHAAAKPAKPANPAGQPGKAGNAAAARALWQRGAGIAGSMASRYLAARGLAGFHSPALRFLPEHRHGPSGTTWPAMLAAVTDPTSGVLLAVHRTYLARDGRHKAPVEPAKATLGPIAGGVIRLAEPEAAKPLVIGEGIESAASAGVILAAPAWAAISAGNLSRIALPPAVREVVVAADHDPVGQREAERAAQRWQAEGRRVRIAMPDAADTDFNDLLMRRRLAREAAHG